MRVQFIFEESHWKFVLQKHLFFTTIVSSGKHLESGHGSQSFSETQTGSSEGRHEISTPSCKLPTPSGKFALIMQA